MSQTGSRESKIKRVKRIKDMTNVKNRFIKRKRKRKRIGDYGHRREFPSSRF